MNLPLERLSPREYEILGLIAEGHTPHQIAARLHVSIQTVRYHLKGIRTRGGWATTEAACAWYGWNRCERLGQYGLVMAAEQLVAHLRKVGA